MKIISQEDTKLTVEMTLPDGNTMTVVLDEHYENGIQMEVKDTDWKLWVDPLYLDPEDGDGSKAPIVHVYPEKWAEEVEGAPVSIEPNGEFLKLRADDDKRLVRNCPLCGGTRTYVSEGRARYGDDGVKCGRCGGTGDINIGG